jgi:EAL domain-containing protein (putative c-di-GMP-specific phosphodiesterase class I)
VIGAALQQLGVWKKSGLDIHVRVNVSPNHIQHGRFIADLEAALAADTALSPQQLELEVLESSAVEDIVGAGEVLGECHRRLGIRFSLDDFGTGYSSLTHMRKLDVAAVKIDRSFVANMIDDPDDYTIVAGVIGLSKAFQREVIAEGVETIDHGLLLMNIGCELAQGYGIARPMPADVLPRWLADYVAPAAWQKRARQTLSPQQAQIQLLTIESMHWLQRLEACLDSADQTPPHWPIMQAEKCHCGRWILHARQENTFAPDWLAQLEQRHRELHRVGNQLMQLHQGGNAGAARAGLNRLQAAYGSITETLAQAG